MQDFHNDGDDSRGIVANGCEMEAYLVDSCGSYMEYVCKMYCYISSLCRLHLTTVDELQCSVDSEIRRWLHSTSSSSLTVRRTWLSTVGDPAFPVATARTWNSLPQHVMSAPSMSVFRGHLKAFLFRPSFPWTHYRNFCSAFAVTVIIFRHLNHSFYLLTVILDSVLSWAVLSTTLILHFTCLQIIKGLLKFWPKTCSQKEVR